VNFIVRKTIECNESEVNEKTLVIFAIQWDASSTISVHAFTSNQLLATRKKSIFARPERSQKKF